MNFQTIVGIGADGMFSKLGLNNIRIRWQKAATSFVEMLPIPKVDDLGVQTTFQPSSDLAVNDAYDSYQASIPGDTLRKCLGAANVEKAIAPNQIWQIKEGSSPWVNCRLEGNRNYDGGADKYQITLRAVYDEDLK